MQNSRCKAFTLVELLVVIGIIALLISILLPGLNKARQQAGLVDCQARVRSMGQALGIYVSEAKGSLPWGVVDHGAAWTNTAPFQPTASDSERFNWWYFTLSGYMLKSNRDSQGFGIVSPIFRDRDTIEAPAGVRYVNHYTANPRVFYQANDYDSAPAIFGELPFAEPAKDRRQRKMGAVRRPSNVFIIWDGPQFAQVSSTPDPGVAYNAYGQAAAIDSWGMDNTTGLCFNAPYTGNDYSKPILPAPNTGFSGVSDGRLKQKERNADFTRADFYESALRFRHMGNTTLTALCLDGHIETRKVGTVMRADIFTNYR